MDVWGLTRDRQCDQIGRCLKSFSNIFLLQSSLIFGDFWRNFEEHRSNKKLPLLLFGNFWKHLGYF